MHAALGRCVASGPTMRLVVTCAAALLIVACSRQSLLESVTTPEDRALGIEIVQALQRGERDKIVAVAEPELVQQISPIFPKMRALLPTGAGTSMNLVDANFAVVSGPEQPTIRHSYLAYEVSLAKRFALVRLTLARKGKDVRLTSLYVNPLPSSTSELSAFTFRGKSAGHYIFLSLAALSLATIVFALVALFRAEGVERKWLWAIGCSLGFGQFVLDWSTGAFFFNPLGVYLFGASVVQVGAIGPWQIGFGIPVIAYWFLIRQAKARRDASEKASKTFQ